MDPPWDSIIYTIGVLGSRVEGFCFFGILPGLWVFKAGIACLEPKTCVGGF